VGVARTVVWREANGRVWSIYVEPHRTRAGEFQVTSGSAVWSRPTVDQEQGHWAWGMRSGESGDSWACRTAWQQDEAVALAEALAQQLANDYATGQLTYWCGVML
jgi:hypothetical protein